MLEDLSRSFTQYNYIGLNSFKFSLKPQSEDFSKAFILRSFLPEKISLMQQVFPKAPDVLNIKELASIYHFPHSRTNRNPRLVWQKFKIVPAPDDLSKEGILLGHNLYGGVKKEIRL